MTNHGYDHRRHPKQSVAPVPCIHAFRYGTHRGVSPAHLPVYLDEFVFRHNHRGTPMAGFQTLPGLGLAHEPTTYREIINPAA